MTARRYHFDDWGKCLGYVDDDQYFDKSGRCLGDVRNGRDFYDIQGVYRGHFDIQGQFWDEHGTYGGYLRGPIARVAAKPACPGPPASTLGSKTTGQAKASLKRVN